MTENEKNELIKKFPPYKECRIIENDLVGNTIIILDLGKVKSMIKLEKDGSINYKVIDCSSHEIVKTGIETTIEGVIDSIKCLLV